MLDFDDSAGCWGGDSRISIVIWRGDPEMQYVCGSSIRYLCYRPNLFWEREREFKNKLTILKRIQFYMVHISRRETLPSHSVFERNLFFLRDWWPIQMQTSPLKQSTHLSVRLCNSPLVHSVNQRPSQPATDNLIRSGINPNNVLCEDEVGWRGVLKYRPSFVSIMVETITGESCGSLGCRGISFLSDIKAEMAMRNAWKSPRRDDIDQGFCHCDCWDNETVWITWSSKVCRNYKDFDKKLKLCNPSSQLQKWLPTIYVMYLCIRIYVYGAVRILDVMCTWKLCWLRLFFPSCL